MSRYVDIEGDWVDDAVKAYSLGYYDDDEYAIPFEALGSAPSIDIVRCGECKKLRDCRHDSWQKGVIEMGYVGWCERTSRLGDVTYVKATDFCSYGSRSEKPNNSKERSE